jgi:hypothetical protein
MAKIRTVDFLPEIFQTPVTEQFLNATLDQLVQEPKFQKTQGFVGRRVGPGVNPNDRYVTEPTKIRTDYQLEPGVVSLEPDSDDINDVITYPGINDALRLQGAVTNNPARLYTSEYYTWDPFVDFDKMVNFSQYYWLPSGPDDVDVSATTVPLTDNITVTRANGAYTFSGISGTNPAITLVRGGNYTFQVAQNAKETVNYRVTNNSTSAYVIDFLTNPTLTLTRGNTYTFDLSLNVPSPFWIKTIASLGNVNTYSTGVSRNGSTTGTITFEVPQDAPDTLYYSSATQFNMRGQINIIDGTPGTGPGFWIQTDPGISGTIPSTPNISSRDVLGVINNGEDLGTVTFNVPLSTAQNFYYGLTSIGTVDLVTNLKFNQINNQFVDPFLEQYGGIDGITNLNGRTVIFLNQIVDAQDGGWQITTQFDPLPDTAPDTGIVGAFDTTTFDQTTDITNQSLRYSVWQIEYVTTSDGTQFMQLNSVEEVNNLEKFSIQFGQQYASTQWYKNAEGYFEQIPLLTAILDTLWYQDGTDPEIFGRIRLIDQSLDTTLNIEDIIGEPDYTSPNGVVFTNGLKVTFRGNVIPESYQNNSYYIEGVGTAIQLLPVTNFVTPETYTKSESIPYDSAPFDVGGYDTTLNAPEVTDYLTINRASPDLNPWTRSNRWFHIDVINATAEYNNVAPTVNNLSRAKRPVLEYRAGTRLFNFGTQGKQPVDIIDFSNTDVLSTINGTTGTFESSNLVIGYSYTITTVGTTDWNTVAGTAGIVYSAGDIITAEATAAGTGTATYSIDGYELANGTRVIFAADSDPDVRNKIYLVEFIVPDTVPPLIAQPIINLVPAADATVLVDQNIVCLSGNTLQGISFYFDGIEWLETQQKTGVNQPPLFDVYDADGISLGSSSKYPSTTFAGNKLFSYAIGPGNVNDPVLGFPLRYLSLANVGDIVFDNNLYKDTFVYVTDSVGKTQPTSIGFVRQYSDRITYVREIGWQPAVTPELIRQQFQFTYDGSPLQLDVKVVENNTVPAIQLYVGSQFQETGNYTYTTTDNTTTIVLTTAYVPGDIIEVEVLSDQISAVGFYQVPGNLESNPLNANSDTFTLGTIRSHYGSIAKNLIALQGPINGANNTRDLGNIIPYGLQILQQSSPLTLAGYFMRNPEYNIFASIEYNSREYIKFKSQLLETVIRNDYVSQTVSQILDSAISEITQGRTELNPFYWSDMLPAGSVFTDTVTTITPITTNIFSTLQTYDFTSSNYLGLLVYLTRTVNNQPETVLLQRGIEYDVAIDGPRLTITIPLAVGEKVTIREYTTTVGNYVPNTPTKIGLYPRFRPEIYVDTSYVNPTTVIQGHDGSITVAFGDIRDQILLEFETRIYNNLKNDNNPTPLSFADIAPGFFRTTGYSQTEITNILSQSFLTWVGWNKIDYKTQDYIANNPFTYNYSSAGNRITNTPLLGAWRGIYRYFYDTESPNTRPWEMLGFSEEPAWWVDQYGPAPYTSDNLVLWDDLEAGYVADPVAPYVIEKYRRPGLTSVLPAGSEGQLLAPIDSVVGPYDPTAFRKSWVVGDGGPAESAWWTSSSYPFAVMRLLALTRPAQFFSLFADRDLYRFDAELDQYLYNGRYRLDANGIEVYGNGVSKASYINWIVDYNQQLGRSSTTRLTEDLQNLDVRLCYRMATFTDKQYLKIYTERSSPDSLNSGLLLPDESYNLLLYKNQPFAEIVYSALIIERVQNGYAVYGYSTTAPYFQIFASASNGLLTTVSAGGASVRVPSQYTDTVVQVPYGYVFTNTTIMVDFILSYGAYLKSQGLVFDDVENGYTLNWNQMAEEFLYFSQQGWAVGTMINLNPSASKLTAVRPGAVVDTIVSVTPENMLLDQNRTVLPTRDLLIERIDNRFTISSATNQTISYLQLRFTNYENLVVLDNLSIFNDLIYNPTTGARQNRIRIMASTTTEWNGTLDAQGFILNQDNVKEWKSNRRYTKGEIVKYKGTYWSAQGIIQPKLEFDYNDWVKSDYTAIQKGLLPNIANKADQLANSYNTNVANLEGDNDLLSYGLIGFRPRQYMEALNLDDVSQVNIYQQFLKSKGTVRSAEIFTRADLGKESAEYNIYENWGVLVSTYGANANRSFIELRLNEALLSSNPSTIQVIQPQQQSNAEQTVLLSDVWRESYKLTSTDILPTTYTTQTDTALPSAGYVNLNDTDINVFSLDDPSSISASLDSIGIGTIIWVAKTNSYDWNIYRCGRVAGQVQQVIDNLNGTSVAQFNTAHDLEVGDLIIIRYFDTAIDGVYRVLSVPSITSVVIAFNFNNTNQTQVFGEGLAFELQSSRVTQASDVALLPFANLLTAGAKAWVDNNGNGHWAVLEKQNPFTSYNEITAESVESNANFGTSITQTLNNFSALVGAPSANSGAGTINAFNQGVDNLYIDSGTLVLLAANTVGFGNSVKFGNQSWAVAGASKSLSNTGYAISLYQIPTTPDFLQVQLLIPPDINPSVIDPIKFGESVTISRDERWMYVGAPDGDRVYAYGRVDADPQSVNYRTDGSTASFNYSDTIQIDSANPAQLLVTLNSNQLTYGADYTIDAEDVIFTIAPIADQPLNIARRDTVQLDSRVYVNVVATGGSGTGARFSVNNVRGVYGVTIVNPGTGYTVGNTLTIPGTSIGGTSPANDVTITITGVTTLVAGIITDFTFTGGGISNTASFNLEPSLYTATNIYSFTVVVDGIIQRPFLDYTFNNGTTTITFTTLPGSGSVISVRAGVYWQYADTITGPSGSRFGHSVDTTTDGRQVMIGAPDDEVTITVNGAPTPILAGNTYVYDRSVIRYSVNDVLEDTYAIPGVPVDPIMVVLNGEYLTSTQFAVNGQYTIVGSDVVLSSSTELTIGDILEIETNQFQLVQTISANSPFDEADFGHAIDVCPTNCSIYIGAPFDGSVLSQAGSVDRRVNQSRVYGVTTSLIANPTLVAGDTIRINNIEVTVPNSPNNTVGGLANAINTFDPPIPNVIASTTTDLTFAGDGITNIFGIGSLYSAADSYTTVVYVNNVLQTSGVDYSYNNTSEQIIFTSAPAKNSVILVVSGRLTLSVKNSIAATPFNKLTILPGVVSAVSSVLPTAFTDLLFDTYPWTQTIVSPAASAYAKFGSALNINDDSTTLVVGAPHGNVYEPVTFDGGNTVFDDSSTTFFTPIADGGVVYTFDYLSSGTDNISNPGLFVFGQQIYDTSIAANDEFGTAVNYTSSRLIIGSPNSTVENLTFAGRVSVFNNVNDTPAWAVIHQQQPVVDIDLINSVFAYDKLTSGGQQYFDFFNPLQGKILGAAQRNIDYIGAVDPADYNVGSIHNLGNSWAQEHVGEIWWDTDTVRFIDPNQDDIVYASRRWGQLFPGSRVDIYQWISSLVAPVSYPGPGTPLSTSSYTVSTALNQQNILETRYYFWVRGLTTIDTKAGKTLSSTGIARYIENPRSSGIPYVAPLNASTVAIYNALDLVSAADTILHIEYDRQFTDAAVHQEFQLIADGRGDSFLNDILYRKMQDSFCGVDTRGGVVPDPFLSPAERYGVQFRPRQSMFADRYTALENYLTRANTVLAQYPIVEMRSFNLLNSREPEPPATVDSTTIWNLRVANLDVLGYQNINTVALGYLYLVDSDSSQNGLWTIYEVAEVASVRVLNLVRVQNYDTRRYWSHIDWYLPGYNNTINPVAEVPNYTSLDTLTLTAVPVGSSVQVTANAQGKFEVYQRTDLGWNRVGLQDGTIQFNQELWNYALGNFGFDVEVFDAQYFDQEPVIETRKIIQAINEELFIDDLAIERNRSLMLMFHYIYSEFTAPEWLVKTSLVDVDHKIRALLPFQTYLQDNQDFVLDYIQEVKPYHVQIREFNLTYDGSDAYFGDLTDFDIPAYFNTELVPPQYVSPVLTPYTQARSEGESTVSDAEPNSEIWTLRPWKEWYNNYLLSIQGVNVVDTGAGYTVAPEVVVTGDCEVPAEMTAIINSAGQVVGVTVDNPGSGYSTTAEITFVGGNGLGARATSIMGNDLVRSIKTVMKYDRYQYSSTIMDWEANTSFDNGTLVRYIDQIWEANSDDSSAVNSPTFNPEQWIRVNPALVTLQYNTSGNYYEITPGSTYITGVDRTMGLYTPTSNQPGLELPLLIDGVDYPGVQVYGLGYTETTELNAIYESSYLDLYLGTRFTDINVDGGAYIDTYSSHAPEELIPGSEFDTMDMRVYTRPGSYWALDGHGFPEVVIKYAIDPTVSEMSFAGLLPYPSQVTVANQSTGIQLVEGVNYTVNWVNQTVTVTSGATTGQIIVISSYELGGGSQLYKALVNGADIGNTLLIPVQFSEIQELAIFVNGQITTDYVYEAAENLQTRIVFGTTLASADEVTLTAIGPTLVNDTEVNYSWSAPQTQVITGTTGVLVYELTNTLEYSNPDNLIVTVNGLRARTSAGAEYYSDDSTEFLLPNRLGFSQQLISDNEVHVYLNDIPQTLNVDFAVEPYSPFDDARSIILNTLPEPGTRVLVTVDTNTQCYVSNNNQLTFNSSAGLIPQDGDVIAVTTWNDTRQQDILTQVFVGPVVTGITLVEGYDEVNYDTDFIPASNTVEQNFVATGSTTFVANTIQVIDTTYLPVAVYVGGVLQVSGYTVLSTPGPLTVVFDVAPTFGYAVKIAVTNYSRSTTTDVTNGTAGSFDYSAGAEVIVNNLSLERTITDPDRLWVTFNGKRIFYGQDFAIQDQELILTSGLMTASDIVIITEFTESLVPEAMAFRIFQDMRGAQATYRITPATTTTLAQPLSDTADIIYVEDASRLSDPNVNINIWGIVTIDGERIMYRERDTVNNTISSLRRGTAGTAAAAHSVGTDLYDMGRGNLLPAEYQNYIVSNSFAANGVTVSFTADNVDVGTLDSTSLEEAVEVYVGGTYQVGNYTIIADNPVTVVFDTPPDDGVEVTILIRRGVTWYAQGINTASDGVALQDTQTKAARFLRGL